MAAVSASVPDLLRALDLTGVFANALLGGAVARACGSTWSVSRALAIVSGLGGGIIRDTLLQRGTPVALTDYAYLTTALIGAVVAFAVRFEGRGWDRLFPFVDALVLGCWAAAGAQKTFTVGLGWLPAVLLGAVTAVGGGAVRDVAVGKIPAVFGGNTLYATSARSPVAHWCSSSFPDICRRGWSRPPWWGLRCACSRGGGAGCCRNTSPGGGPTVSGIAGGRRRDGRGLG